MFKHLQHNIKSLNDVSVVSTMFANKEHQINSNLVENNVNQMYNQKLYNESLAKLISFIKPTELLQRYSNCNPMFHTTNQSLRHHPYLKMNNNYSNVSSHQLSMDSIYTQNEHNIQNFSNQSTTSYKNSINSTILSSYNQKSPK